MKKLNLMIKAGVAAIALAIALAGCGAGADSAEPVPSEPPAQAPEPEPEPEPAAEPAPDYSINTDLLSYIGKTPEEISLLLGDFEEAKWQTRMLFKYGGFWFAFDGVSDSPEGALSFIVCSASDLIDGLSGETPAADLDGVFGSTGVYEAGGNESGWYSGGYITYEYDGVIIGLGCSPDMTVKSDATVLIYSASAGGDIEYAMARIIPSPFGRTWEDLEPAEWYGSGRYRTLYFSGNGEVEYNMGTKHTNPDIYETYEIYKGTYQAVLDEDSGAGYDVIILDLALDWWIWEFAEGAEDEVTLAMHERMDLKGEYRAWEEGGSLKLEFLSGQPLDTISMGGDPVEKYSFAPMQ